MSATKYTCRVKRTDIRKEFDLFTSLTRARALLARTKHKGTADYNPYLGFWRGVGVVSESDMGLPCSCALSLVNKDPLRSAAITKVNDREVRHCAIAARYLDCVSTLVRLL